jgi:hypothetical protein
VLFLGDALYQCLWGDPVYLTVAGTRALLERLAPFDPAFALEGHDPDVADAAAYATRLDELRRACDLVEQHGADALRLAPDHGGEWFVENVEQLLSAPD